MHGREQLADRTQADGNLNSSRAVYRQIIGTLPGNLTVPDLPSGLPTNVEEVIALSENNPAVTQAVFLERAARDGTDVVFGELLPTVSIVGEVGTNDQISNEDLSSSGASIFARVVIPLYQASVIYGAADGIEFTPLANENIFLNRIRWTDE